jgi:hypothetical protein
VIKTIQLSDDSDPEKQAHVREVVLDKLNQRLYVSGIGRKGKGCCGWSIPASSSLLKR